MTRTKCLTLAASLAAASIVSIAASAYAADRFAVISIANQTNANITVSYHWGDGQRRTHSFTPGARHWFSYKYPRPDADHSPDFFVTFDADTTNQRYGEDKKLHGYRAPEENYNLGHKYAFKYNGPSKRYIEIYDER
jgi:hypothetical protein